MIEKCSLIILLLGIILQGCRERPNTGDLEPPKNILGCSEACIHPVVIEDCLEGWCAIPAGCFCMGSPEEEPGRDPWEIQHEVTLTYGFEIMADEVTQAQYAHLMVENPARFGSCGAVCPVESVTWNHAVGYANRLSEEEGLPPCYECGEVDGREECALNSEYAIPQECTGYRLPTEAEWEYAARAGHESAFPNEPISDTECEDLGLAEIGWYCGNAQERTHPTGEKPPNGWGLHDTSGNVAEWVWDRKARYPNEPIADPTGGDDGAFRLYRGGGWFQKAQECRSAYRPKGAPIKSSYIGFRLARTLAGTR